MKTKEDLSAEYQVNLKIVIGALSPPPKKDLPLAAPDEIELIESPSHGRVKAKDAEEKEDAAQQREEYISETINWFQELLSPPQRGVPSWEDILQNHRNFIVELEKHLQSTDFVSIDDQYPLTDLPYISTALGREVTQKDIDIREENLSSVANATRSKDALAKRAFSALHAFFIVIEEEAERNGDKDHVKRTLLPQVTQQAYQALRSCLETIQSSSDSAAEVDRLRSEALKNFNNALVENLRDNLHLDQKAARKQLQAGEEITAWEQRSLKPVVTLKQISEIHNVVVVEEPIVNHRALLKALAFLDNKEAEKPKWFQRLNPVKKSWLRKNKDRLKNDELACPSSLTNDIPGVANFARHTFAVYDDGGNLISRSSHIRRRTPAPMSVKSEKERMKFATENADTILKEADPITQSKNFWEDADLAKTIGPFHNDQSLVSPVLPQWSPVDVLSARFKSYPENNMIMRDTAREAFKKAKTNDAQLNSLTLHVENYPTNLMRVVSHGIEYNKEAMLDKAVFIAKACDAISNKLGDAAAQLIQSEKRDERDKGDALRTAATHFSHVKQRLQEPKFAEKISDLKTTANELFLSKDKWEQHLFKNDYAAKSTALCMAIDALGQSCELFNNPPSENGNNLSVFAAAYSRLMVQGFGGTTSGGCKSAKDREGIVQLHTDAMAVFYAQKGYLPKYSDGNDPTDTTPFEDRKHFVEIMADLFDAGYEQYAANLNAFGCFGVQEGHPSWVNRFLNVPLLGAWLRKRTLIPDDLRAEITGRHPGEYEAQQSIAKTRKLEISKERKPLATILKTVGFVLVGALQLFVWFPLTGTFYLGKGILWDAPKAMIRWTRNQYRDFMDKPPLLSEFAESVQEKLVMPKTASEEEESLLNKEEKGPLKEAVQKKEEKVQVQKEASHEIEMHARTPRAQETVQRSEDSSKGKNTKATPVAATTDPSISTSSIPPPPSLPKIKPEKVPVEAKKAETKTETKREQPSSPPPPDFIPGRHSIFSSPPGMQLGSENINLNGLKAVLEALCTEKNLATDKNGKWSISGERGISIHHSTHRTSMHFSGQTLIADRPSDQKNLEQVCEAMADVMAKALGEKAKESTIEVIAKSDSEKHALKKACEGKFKEVIFASDSRHPDSEPPPSQVPRAG